MKISLNHIAAATLLIISLVMPLACDAACLLDLVDSSSGVHFKIEPDSSDGEYPCPECPTDNHCECDSCSRYAPVFQCLAIDYSPTIGFLDFLSINTKPPQVYYSIFVPPQNFFTG